MFVERKTHREACFGELSVKERFIVNDNQVCSLLNGTYDIDAELRKMREKGKKEEAIAEWLELASDCTQAINSKQLEPTMRTQYMRTAFQIPFDATVRVSLDTNLCMITERSEDAVRGSRWFRDPHVQIPKSEITRFPHAVLEVKLQLSQEGATPAWVSELIDSGMLLQVHKFSKFIHGCATLLPDDVPAFPYWIDDPTLRESIQQSGNEKTIFANPGNSFTHMLPHQAHSESKTAIKPRVRPHQSYGAIGSGGEDDLFADESASLLAGLPHSPHRRGRRGDGSGGDGSGGGRDDCDCLPFGSGWCDWASPMETPMDIVPQKIEPKLIFANERTFIKWLHMAVLLSSSSVAVLAFSGHDSDAEKYALMLLPIALIFTVYSVWTFTWRNEMITSRDSARWDDPLGPVLLTVLLIFAMSIQFLVTLWKFVYTE